jgi:hypothetical protein
MGIFDGSSYFSGNMGNGPGDFKDGYINGQWVGMNPGMNIGSANPNNRAQAGGAGPVGTEGAFGLYNTAVEQQAKDYDNIMSGYKGFNSSAPMQNFSELAATGGYSEQGKQDLRERGVSPIRSIYANANRDVDRQKALQGGYSPNYTAAKTKLARDLSQDIGDRVTSVNAGIAQNVASNRVGLAPGLASQSFAPLSGQASLYGTTPALANTFGNQAMNSAQLQNQIYTSPGGQNPAQAAPAGGASSGGIARRATSNLGR